MVPPRLAGAAVRSLNTPIGNILVCANDDGVLSITFDQDGNRNPSGKSDTKEARQHLDTCITWLDHYFSDPSKTSTVESPKLNTADYSSRKFCTHVWKTLQEKISPGETVSYGKLAAMCGKPRAARAVGMAMRTNPFPIIVPCHRVVTSTSGIGNYSGGCGPKTKQWLIDYEKEFAGH